jgi:hypothetical protein
MTIRPIHPNWISKDEFIRGIGMLCAMVNEPSAIIEINYKRLEDD